MNSYRVILRVGVPYLDGFDAQAFAGLAKLIEGDLGKRGPADGVTQFGTGGRCLRKNTALSRDVSGEAAEKEATAIHG
jgi:hypothetical protein